MNGSSFSFRAWLYAVGTISEVWVVRHCGDSVYPSLFVVRAASTIYNPTNVYSSIAGMLIRKEMQWVHGEHWKELHDGFNLQVEDTEIYERIKHGPKRVHVLVEEMVRDGLLPTIPGNSGCD